MNTGSSIHVLLHLGHFFGILISALKTYPHFLHLAGLTSNFPYLRDREICLKSSITSFTGISKRCDISDARMGVSFMREAILSRRVIHLSSLFFRVLPPVSVRLAIYTSTVALAINSRFSCHIFSLIKPFSHI